jgi:transcriptional regulator with XRE-family HTH domain
MDGRARDKAAAQRFGRNLWKARRRADLSQEELGRLASLHRTHIGFMEAGGRLPRVDTLVKLASALGVEADALLQGIGWIVPGANRPGSFSTGGARRDQGCKANRSRRPKEAIRTTKLAVQSRRRCSLPKPSETLCATRS